MVGTHRRQAVFVVAGVHRRGHALLLEIADTTDGSCFFSCDVQCGKQQSRKNRDDLDYIELIFLILLAYTFHF